MQLTSFCGDKAAGKGEYGLLQLFGPTSRVNHRTGGLPPLWSSGNDLHLPDGNKKTSRRRINLVVITGFLVLIKLVYSLYCASATGERVGEALSIERWSTGTSTD
jgi:hypothetical protein